MKQTVNSGMDWTKSRARRASLGAVVLVAALWLTAAEGWAQTNVSRRIDETALRLISDRNIFNPNRYSRSSPSSRPRTESRPASRVEYFTLVGLMAYEKGTFAFFDGTSASYKKTLEADGAISEFKVAALSPREVRLVSGTGTNQFVMHVGMQVRREDEGDWFLTEPGQATRNRVVLSRARSRTAGGEGVDGAGVMEGALEPGMEGEPEVIILESEPTTVTPEVNGEAANGSDGITDPVLLRLMQRRQELEQ